MWTIHGLIILTPSDYCFLVKTGLFYLWICSNSSMLGIFNTPKTKLISFHHHCSDWVLSNHNKWLHSQWNSMLWMCIAIQVKLIYTIYCWRYWENSQHILSLQEVPDSCHSFFHYKSQIRPKTVYCCHIRTGTVQSSLCELLKLLMQPYWR